MVNHSIARQSQADHATSPIATVCALQLPTVSLALHCTPRTDYDFDPTDVNAGTRNASCFGWKSCLEFPLHKAIKEDRFDTCRANGLGRTNAAF